MAGLLALLTLPTAADAAIRTWPGAAPCHTTLQACIGASAAGDVIEVASNGPITDPVFVMAKSLTLRAAPGFAPVFHPAQFTNAIDVFGGNQPVTIVIEGMVVREGAITAFQAGSGAFNVSLRRNTIEAEGLDANRTAIRLAPFGDTHSGAVTFEILDNEIRLGFLAGDEINAITVEDLSGATVGRVVGNTIVAGGEWSTLAAITLHNSHGEATFDVLGNTIAATGYNGGILVHQDGATGTIDARIINNLVAGTIVVMAPQPGAVSLLVGAGTAEVLVTNNTLVDNDIGFVASAASGASLTGVVANSIVAGNDDGIVIGASIGAGFSNGHNLVFDNGANSFVPGTGTVFADPLFAGAGNYRLRAGSPARDAGNDAYMPADITVDLDGAPRVAGPHVDIGAYELGDLIFRDGFDGTL